MNCLLYLKFPVIENRVNFKEMFKNLDIDGPLLDRVNEATAQRNNLFEKM